MSPERNNILHIHQRVVVLISPQRVYEALPDASSSATSQAVLPLRSKLKTRFFSCSGGTVHGRNIEWVPPPADRPGVACQTWENVPFLMARFEPRQEGSDTRIIF